MAAHVEDSALDFAHVQKALKEILSKLKVTSDPKS
jgi:hypothetical protein